ncbi:MAG: tetratricopeptide repeat protein [Chitinophagaceae bacterium]|nr:tetratricopeptide repeat protein [Chitinophagaceae bacterium]
MKKTFFSLIVLFFFTTSVFAQKETLSPEATKDLLNKIKFDTTVFLSSAATRACKCIDSISISNKNREDVSKDISACIDKVTSYQLSLKLIQTLQNSQKNHTITINPDKNSREYKQYYYDIERWLMDSCKALETVISANNKVSEKSSSSDLLALKEYNKGIDIIKEDDYKKALPFFKKATELDPEFAFAWDNLGLCERKIGNLDAALIAYKNSLRIDPKGKMPLQNLPIVYEFKKEYDSAIKAYEELLAIYPDDPESFYGAGRIYFAYKKDDEKALQSMCKAYNLYIEMGSPYRVDAEKMINYIYTQMKKNGKEDIFNKILKENKINPSTK